MTVAVKPSRASYLGDGVTVAFSAPFRFLSAAELNVTLVAGDGTIRSPSFSATGGLTDAGGTVTVASAPAAGVKVRIARATARRQPADYVNSDTFPSDTAETNFDRLTLIVQEQDDALADLATRAVIAPDGGTGVSFDGTGLADGDLLEFRNGALRRFNSAPFAGMFYAGGVGGHPVPASGTGSDANLRGDLAQQSGARLSGFVQAGADSTARTVEDKLREIVTPEDKGAVGDGVANDRAAILAARTHALLTGAQIVLGAGKNYNVGSTLTDISGVAWIAGEGSRISGNVDLTGEIIAPNGLLIHVNSAGVVYDYRVGREKQYEDKALWLTDAATTRETVARVDCTTLAYEQVAWPSGDTWSASTPSATSADAWTPNAASGNIWYGAFRKARAGQQLRATFASGAYQRGVIVRHSGGYVVLWGTGTGGSVSVKNVGVAVSTSSVSWQGLADHAQWNLDNAEYGIRVYDLTTVGFVINGYEVYRATVSGIISDVGFGVFASGSPVTPAVSYWSEVIGDHFRGQQSISIDAYGDSLTSPFASGKGAGVFTGSWINAMREALDFSRHGIRVSGWSNYAVAGENTANMWTRLNANLAGSVANVIVLHGGTNDVQGGSALSSTIANMTAMLSAIQSAGRKALVVIPGLWLNSTQGAQGFASSNAEKAAPMRAVLRSLAGQYNALIADLTEIEGQILSATYDTTTIADGRKRDRIHETPLAYRVIGEFIASVIAGYWARKVSKELTATALPAAWYRNSWTTTTEAPYVRISPDGNVEMTGILDAGTKADSTTVLQLPPSLRPAVNRRFNVKTNAGNWARLILDNTGAAKIYGLGTDSYIVLEGVRWAL